MLRVNYIPRYYAGNVWGYNSPRAYRNFGGPHWGGDGSGIVPPLSRAEFKSHFLFDSSKIVAVLALLDFPRSPGRPMNKDFAYMHNSDGEPIRWVSQETAFLVFLKRMRTRGSLVIQLQSFFWQIRRMDISGFQRSVALFVHKMGPYEDS